MTKNEAISIIRASPLSRYQDRLVAALTPSARLRASRARPAKDTGSRLGGIPSLPADIAWPRWNCVEYLDGEIRRTQEILSRVPPGESFAKTLNRTVEKLVNLKAASPLPLVFLGQIDLADLSGMEVGATFPSRGMLWFFCDMFKQPWGFDPTSQGAWRCLYRESLPRRLTPKPEIIHDDWMRPVAGIEVVPEYTLPALLPIERNRVLTRNSVPEYDAICERLSPSRDEVVYRLGGQPQESGEDMRLEIQLAANGVFCGDPSAMRHPRRPALEPGAKDWALLLQLDSGGAMDWGWGDMGRVYFWCRSEAIRRGDFEGTWLAIASH